MINLAPFTSPNKTSNNKFYVNYAETSGQRMLLACPDKVEIPDEIWAPGQPDNENGLQSATALDLNSPFDQIGVDDVSPRDKLNIMCEVIITNIIISAFHKLYILLKLK
jgi:hypothetical protein